MNGCEKDWQPDLFKYRRRAERVLIIMYVALAAIVVCVIILLICQTAKENAEYQSTIRVEKVGN